ncbi:MAG: BON domain-containing protein [Gammaproteobacteria bacterium]|nr:BON domain-containing protein [Gammaproteobacteria bacterium]
MKSGYLYAILAASFLVSLGGCVIVVDGKGDMETEWASTWEAENESAAEANKRLAREVSAVLAADSLLAGEEINVSARRGAVALHGKVGNTAAVDRALQLAADVPGVESVVSRLSVQFVGH